MRSNNEERTRWLSVASGLTVLFGVAFFAAVNNGFVSDDWFFLAEAQKLLDTGDFGRIFSFRSDWFYRPLQFLVTAFLYQLTGAEVFGYRLLVILLHAANGILLGRFAFRLLQRGSSTLPALELAWLVGAFFVFSPRHHEAIFWYAAASEPLSMLLRLVGLLLLLEALDHSDQRGWLATFGVLLAFGASLATKEPAIAFGAEAGLVFLFVLATPARRRLDVTVRGAMIGVCLIGIALLWLTGYLGAGTSLQRSLLVPLEASPTDWTLRFLQGFARQLFFVPLVTKAPVIWKLAGVLLLVLVAAAAKRKWLLPFAFFWNLALLAPYAGTTAVADQVGQVPILLRTAGFEDRYLYYPTAGLALFLLVLVDFLLDLTRSNSEWRSIGRRATILVVGSWVLVGTFLLWQRERDWDVAGDLARRQTESLLNLVPPQEGTLCLTRLPAYFDNYRGHYVLRNALPNLLFVQLGRRDFDVLMPPIRREQVEQCDVMVDLNAAWAGRTDAATYPRPNLMLENLGKCLGERRPVTQTGEGRETLVYVHLFRGEPIGKVGQFLWPTSKFQELERPDDALFFFRLWVGDHRSAVLTSDLLVGTFQENLADPDFRAGLLEMGDRLGSRQEVESLLKGPLELPPALRIYQNRLLYLPGPYTACDPARPANGPSTN